MPNPNKSDSIRVCCLALPDGKFHWVKAEKATAEYLRKFTEEWMKSLPEEVHSAYVQNKVSVGLVTIYMLRKDWEKVLQEDFLEWGGWSKIDA
jgi:hypothetical protein